MTKSCQVWRPLPLHQLKPGDRIWPTRNGRIRVVNKVQRWTRWDGADMVTVLDTDGNGLGAREACWLVLCEVWEDDGRVLRPLQGRAQTPLLKEVEEVLGGELAEA